MKSIFLVSTLFLTFKANESIKCLVNNLLEEIQASPEAMQ